jgi:hypothetical protein
MVISSNLITSVFFQLKLINIKNKFKNIILNKNTSKNKKNNDIIGNTIFIVIGG